MAMFVQIQLQSTLSSCECPRSEKGYYQLKCVTGKCKECKGHKPLFLKCQNNSSLAKVSHFELVTREYLNKMQEKKNHPFTSAVVNDIIQKHGLPLILHFKSDNCSMQYKCK